MDNRSVDPAERDKFNRFAELWWDTSGPMWPLHRLNKFRIGFIRRVICNHFGINADTAKPFSDLNILDIGCGGGILSETMASLGATVYGVDISERNIEVARQHAAVQELAVTYEVGTAEELASKSLCFDVVLNMEVVEHVADLSVFMQACNALVRVDGLQFVSTINRNPWAWFIAIFGAEIVLRWLPRGTHEYAKLVKPAELNALLAAGHFDIIERTGVAVNPITRNMSQTNSESVNYMLAARKTAG